MPDASAPMPVTGTTRVFAIIGDPVAQVRSPDMFNQFFAARAVDAILVPLRIPASELDAVLPALKRIPNLGGLVVTVPHKVEATRHVDALGSTAARVGAVNAMARTDDDKWVGEMFDGTSFVSGLRRKGFEPQGQHVFLAGAGGAGRAVGHALADAGVGTLRIFDVDHPRAADLVAGIRRHHPALDVAVSSAPDARCDLAVNATPLGMAAGDPVPFDLAPLPERAWIAEMVMKPEMTPLLERARARGHPWHIGRNVLENQIELIARFFGALP